MPQLNLAAAGNADENINLINPRFMAEALRRLRGYDVGILDNSFFTETSPKGLTRVSNADFMWKLTATNVLDIAVGRGMATAYGYDLQSEQTIHLRGTAPSAGTKYLMVYLEWDLSNPVEAKGKIDLHDNGSSDNWTPRKDNLILNPMGVYQLDLYHLAVNASGRITGSQPGADWTKKIGNPLLAENARHAEVATNTETLAGEPVSLSGNSLCAGSGKAILRRKLIFSGSWVLYNTASKDTTNTLTEALQSGDTIMVEFEPQYYSGSSGSTEVVICKVGGIKGLSSSTPGFNLTAVFGGFGYQNGFTATSDNFLVSGTTITYKGGYYLLNFANDGGSLLQNNSIRVTKIYKLYA